MVLPAHSGSWSFIQFHNHFSQTVGLLGRGISPSQGRYLHTGQHNHRINAHRHPCPVWDLNLRSQGSSERRQFMPSFLLSPWRYSSGWALASWIISLHFSLFFICSDDKAPNGRMKKWVEYGWKRSWPTYFRWFYIHSIRDWLSGSWTV
jgi:hypothetical protein